MKHLKYLAVLTVMIFGMSVSAMAQVPPACEATDPACGPWVDALPFEFLAPNTSCPMTLYYQVQVCPGHTNIRLKTLSIEYKPECMDLINLLMPGGVADQDAIFLQTRNAATAFMEYMFLVQRQEVPDPSIYDCNHRPSSTLIYRYVTKGGCTWMQSAWRWRTSGTGKLIHMKVVSCDDEGCCVFTREYCYNSSEQKPFLKSKNVEFIGNDPSCFLKAPIENPFADYGPDWHVIDFDDNYDQCSFRCYFVD